MYNSSLLNQAITADNAFLDVKSSIGNSNDEFEQVDNYIFIGLLNTKTNNRSHSKKSKKQISKSDAAKRALFSIQIFDYIHTTKCQRLFSLA